MFLLQATRRITDRTQVQSTSSKQEVLPNLGTRFLLKFIFHKILNERRAQMQHAPSPRSLVADTYFSFLSELIQKGTAVGTD